MRPLSLELRRRPTLVSAALYTAAVFWAVACTSDPGGAPGAGGASAGAPGGTATGGTGGTGGIAPVGSGGGSPPGSGGANAAGSGAVAGGQGTGGQGTGGQETGGRSAAGGTKASPGGTAGRSAGGAGGAPVAAGSYDQLILSNGPVAYWAMSATTTEPDLTGKTNSGSYKGGAPTPATLPNGDRAADFNGSSQYLTIPSHASFSIPSTGSLTWEAWIRPDVLQFSHASGDGYVDWMGKCEEYGPTCEWEARMYSTNTAEGRPNRISAYVFKPSAGLGSAADWQPVDGLIKAGAWYYVVGEYTTTSQPADCMDASASMGCQTVAKYPGSINIWVNGVEWSHASHGSTGCMCQYGVVPVANDSPLDIGTMAKDAWFAGAIGKVALYDKLLSSAEITRHYKAMTGQDPTGSCQSTCKL